MDSAIKKATPFIPEKAPSQTGNSLGGWLNRNVFALAWPLILIGRVLGWFGRGIRGPLRDAMLADSVDQRFRGKAFGFHRAGDTIGAAVRDYIDESTAGTTFGMLGVVNGVGDLVSSLAVGLLLTSFGAIWGFGYAVVVGLARTLWMRGLRVVKR